MQRITITLDDDLVAQFEEFLVRQGYSNRSEAFRDLIRERLAQAQREKTDRGACFATLTYVYDHHQRDLASRMTEASHAHHDLTVSTLHVHLDHNNCLETAVLHGPTARVQAFADQVMAESGVRHGKLYVLPVKASAQTHRHGHSEAPHRHLHIEPLT